MHGIDLSQMATQSATSTHLYAADWLHTSSNLCKWGVCCCLSCFLKAISQQHHSDITSHHNMYNIYTVRQKNKTPNSCSYYCQKLTDFKNSLLLHSARNLKQKDHYRSHHTVFWNTVCTGPSRSPKVVDFGTNRKCVCDFLLVINSNLAPVSEIL